MVAAEATAACRFRVLLLGAGESGKSTVLKQLRIAYGRGYSIEERAALLPACVDNALASMRILIDLAEAADTAAAAGKVESAAAAAAASAAAAAAAASSRNFFANGCETVEGVRTVAMIAALPPTPRTSRLPAPPRAARRASGVRGTMSGAGALPAPPPWQSAAAQQAADRALIRTLPAGASVDAHCAAAMARLWRRDKGIAAACAEAGLADTGSAYFLDRIEELVRPGAVPSLDDVLRVRICTTGIIEEAFTVDGAELVVIDVGGQRCERRKWLQAFAGVTAVIFVAALNEYDKHLAEDATRNRISESVELYAEVANAPWFKDAAVLLFLNKADLFTAKLDAGVPLRSDDAAAPRFLDYRGTTTREALAYLSERFTEHDRRADAGERKPYVTTAVDTGAMRAVLDGVKDFVLARNIAEVDL